MKELKVKVTPEGVQFGDFCFYSHEYITRYEATELNSGNCDIAAKEYMKWVKQETEDL